ncbi:MAG: hypothetical protein IAG10_28845 [Planctomycetaceae bacterium]|nr:hypothetical protein [Planctomycetaceae bacterium]
MAHTSSRGSQSNAQPNSTADADLAALIEQCSKDVRCGLSRAHYLCKLMHAPYRFGTLEQIDRETADWLMLSVNPLLDYYRAAAKTFPIVNRLVNAVADRTCAHEEALEFAHEVQLAFVCQHSSTELLEMADTVVSQWQSIRDFLLQRKCPDLKELLNRIKVEWAKAIESQRRQTNQQLGDSPFVADKTHREPREKPSVELSVAAQSQRATLRTAKGEELFDLPSEGVARWLKVLAEHPDEWIRPADYKTHGGDELDGVKPSDKLQSLKRKCPKLAKLIEASRHDGMRFNPALAVKLGRSLRPATN